MTMAREKVRTIKGLKIKYEGEEIDNVTSFSMWSGENFNFEYMKNANTQVRVSCKLSDVEIIQSK